MFNLTYKQNIPSTMSVDLVDCKDVLSVYGVISN